MAAAGGGYFPTAWGWAALAFLVVAGAALVVPERAGLGALDRLFLGALGGLAGWTALSILWSQSVPSSIAEVERSLVYVAGVLAVLLVVGRTSAQRLMAGTLAGMLYALILCRRRQLSDAVVAHAITTALAAYVVAAGAWSLWP